MSSQAMGRLGRRALGPLAQHLERAAPGAMQQFSSSASEPPAAGRGAGRGAGDSQAPGSGPRGPGSMGRGAPRGPRPEGAHAGGFRPRGPRRAEGEQGGGGGERRWQRRGERFGGGGRDDGRGGMARPAAAGAVPAELNDSPYEILTRFQYALKDAANPEAPAVPLQDMPMDIADIANTDNLALFKYYVTPQQWDRFCAGDMDEDEQNELADKLAAALVADDRHRARQAGVAAAIDADPDYDLAASLSSRPQLRGSPRPAPPTVQALGAELEAQKGAVMAQYRMSEEEYEAAKAATVEQQLAAARAAAAPVLPNHLAHAWRLTALLDKAMPRDHPNYGAARERLEVLQGNPGWSQERKMVFAKRLIKRLSSA